MLFFAVQEMNGNNNYSLRLYFMYYVTNRKVIVLLKDENFDAID